MLQRMASHTYADGQTYLVLVSYLKGGGGREEGGEACGMAEREMC